MQNQLLNTEDKEQRQAWLAEKIKDGGYFKYHKAKTPEEKADAIERVIQGHYIRESQFFPWLEFDEYRRHFISANMDNWFGDAIEYLARRHGTVEKPNIRRNHKSWQQ